MSLQSLITTRALQRLVKNKLSHLKGRNVSSNANLHIARDNAIEEGLMKLNPVLEGKTGEFLRRTLRVESLLLPSLVVAIHMQLFKKLRDAGGKGLSTDALSPKSTYHRSQLDRVLRHLAASKIIAVKSAGVWLSTALSDKLAEPYIEKSVLFHHLSINRAANAIPEYFKRLDRGDYSSLQNPVGSQRGPFQIGLGTERPFFDWLRVHPQTADCFNLFMKAYREGDTPWFAPDLYPVQERLFRGFDSAASDVLLVDVGGGRGHELALFAEQYKTHPGKLILQDQASVIGEVNHEQHVFETQIHDFFTTQPIKAARAYFLHSIVHNWGDEQCIRILSNLASVLKPGYSKVLLNEIVLSEENPTQLTTSMDMLMLAQLNPAHERTRSAFRSLLEKSGLKITAIFNAPGCAESLIEAERA